MTAFWTRGIPGAFAVGGLVLAWSWPSLPQDEGRIEGKVVISRAIATRRPAFRIYSDPGPGAQPPKETGPDSIAELGNVVVYLEPVPGRAPADVPPPEGSPRLDSMVQHNETFVPHVLPVLVGATVAFPNEDPVYHNVFSISSAKTFEIRRIPKGAPVSETSRVFDKPGIVQVFCHIHSDMSGIVFVLPNPYFATPASSGHYIIDHIPPGDYTLIAWHERIKPISRLVHIVAGENGAQNFLIPLPAGARDP